MLKPLVHPLFISSVLLYLGVKLCRLFSIQIPTLITNYLADLVCMPIVLSSCLVGVRLTKKSTQYRLTGIQIFAMTSFYAVLFELYLPKINPIYTGDSYDVVAYFIGAIVYFLVYQQNNLRQSVGE